MAEHLKQTLPSAPTISIVVPVHNGGSSFHACMQSLRAAYPAPDEIIVVADGDTDGSRDVARACGARVLIHDLPGGPAVARNAGARAARGDILYFVDADVTVRPDAISRIRSLFQVEPGIAAVMGSYDDAPAAPNFLSQYKNLLHHYVHQRAREETGTFWGACGAIRRDIFWAVGGFDESYREPSIEDIELGSRLARHGYRIRLVKELQVKHLKRWTPRALLYSDIFQRALPWTDLILRERNMMNDLNVDYTGRLSVIGVFMLLASLGGTLFRRGTLPIAVVLAAALLLLNLPLYRFFALKRGWWFAVRAVPWHWLYFAYGGAAFAAASLRRTARVLRERFGDETGFTGARNMG